MASDGNRRDLTTIAGAATAVFVGIGIQNFAPNTTLGHTQTVAVARHRSHVANHHDLLRHTMANRLLAGGSSLKEVADVLRHRSMNTTMIYAKLDSRNLAQVALPWPGSAA